MNAILNALETFSADTCATLVLALMALLFGAWFVDGRPALRRYGQWTAVCVLLGYLLISGAVVRPHDAYAWVEVVFRATVLGSLALGISWIALGIGYRGYKLVVIPFDKLDQGRKRIQLQVQTEVRRRAEAERRARAAEQEAAERSEREREAKRSRERRLADEEQAREDQRRREAARFACDLAYAKHAQALRKSLPRRAFAEYVEHYLGDDAPAGEVEKRAAELQSLIASLGTPAGSGPQFSSLADIRAHFDKERERVHEADFDGETTESLLADLSLAEDRAIRGFRGV